MPGQVIGTVNVQVGNQTNPRVNTINYGIRSLKGSTDLTMTGAQSGDVIVYNADTKTFNVEPASAAIPSLDAGEF